jgi:uncharacterized protein with GYD domain
MPTFVHLVSLTDDGQTTFVDGPQPHPGKTAHQFGGEILADFLTLGRYDIVVVSSFPDAESATRFSLAMNREGQSSTETMRAFDTEEVRVILQGMEKGSV